MVLRTFISIIIFLVLAFALKVAFTSSVYFFQKDQPQNLDSLARVYNNTGVDYMLEGDHEKASELFNKSLKIRESIPDFPKGRLAYGYLNLAILKQDMSYIDSAIFYYKKTESILLSMENPPASTLGITYYAYGSCLSYKQDYKTAIAYIQRGINLLSQDSLKNSMHLVLATINLANEYRSAGLLEEAHNTALKAKILSEKFGRVYYSNANSAIGITYLAQKDYSNAIKYYRIVEELIEKGEKWRGSGLIALYSNLALSYDKIGDNKKANQYYIKGVEIGEILKVFTPQQALLLQNYGLYLKNRGELEKAEKYIQKSLSLNTKDQNSYNFYESNLSNFFSPLIAIQSYDGLGSVYLERFKENNETQFAQKSFDHYSRAIYLMDELRAAVSDESDKLYLDYIYHPLYLNTINACFTFSGSLPNSIEYAFKVSSKAKAAILNQAISRERGIVFSGVPNELVDKERELRLRVSTLNEFYHEEKLKSTPSPKQLKSLEDRIFKSQNEYKELVNFVETKHPKYYALKFDTTSVSVGDVQKSLKTSQVLVDYIITDSTLISFAVTKGSFNWESKKLSSGFFDSLNIFLNEVNPSSFENLNRINLENFAASSFYLYQVLLKPFESLLAGRELIVIPHQQLSAIPFNALLGYKVENPRGYYSLPYLVRNMPISYFPSTKLFITNPKSKRSLNLSTISYAPSYNNSNNSSHYSTLPYRQNLSDLPGAEREAQELNALLGGTLVFGSQATEDNFKSNAGKYHLLHLAMHTHIDEKNSLYSKLIFTSSSDTTEDGFLNVYEVYGLRLNAKLVVISACRSGDGTMVRGEGLLSLARGFQYAGAPSLVAAQWRVDDYSGSEVMIDFARNLKKGASKGKALQRAQQKFLDNADPLRSHPYFWASYQIR